MLIAADIDIRHYRLTSLFYNPSNGNNLSFLSLSLLLPPDLSQLSASLTLSANKAKIHTSRTLKLLPNFIFQDTSNLLIIFFFIPWSNFVSASLESHSGGKANVKRKSPLFVLPFPKSLFLFVLSPFELCLLRFRSYPLFYFTYFVQIESSKQKELERDKQ